jgi:hypothetical protein
MFFSLSFVFSAFPPLTFSLCRSTENDHVKDSLPAKLLRIRTFGKMRLEEFKDLLSVADYKMCESKMEKNPTWYPLTLDVFVKFLYKVINVYGFVVFSSSVFMLVPYHSCGSFQRDISNASDIAARLYREATPEALRSSTEIWNVMTKAQEKLIKSIRSRNFEKYISVAHKDNGDDFFNEVPRLSLCFHCIFIVLSSLYCRHCIVVLDISFLLFALVCGRLTVIFPPFSFQT